MHEEIVTNGLDRDLRKLLVVGATAVMRMARKDARQHPCLAQLLERTPAKVATIGLANKTVRIIRAVMARNECLRDRFRAAAVFAARSGDRRIGDRVAE